MSTTTKVIIGIIVLGMLGLVALFAYQQHVPGAIIAGLAGIWAAFKARILGQYTDDIRHEHSQKRAEWERVRQDFHNELRPLKERIAVLEGRSAALENKLAKQRKDEAARVTEMKEEWTGEERARYLDSVLGNL